MFLRVKLALSLHKTVFVNPSTSQGHKQFYTFKCSHFHPGVYLEIFVFLYNKNKKPHTHTHTLVHFYSLQNTEHQPWQLVRVPAVVSDENIFTVSTDDKMCEGLYTHKKYRGGS